jgi:hypothetical protein
MNKEMRRLIVAAAVLAAGFAVPCGADEEERDPLTRQEFAQKVFRGVPKADVEALLGSPDAEKPGDSGNVEMLYKERIIQPATGRCEDVTVIIFVLYETVGAVRWADGTVTSSLGSDAIDEASSRAAMATALKEEGSGTGGVVWAAVWPAALTWSSPHR